MAGLVAEKRALTPRPATVGDAGRVFFSSAAAQVRHRGRPTLALFRGEADAVQVDVEARTVAFTGS